MLINSFRSSYDQLHETNTTSEIVQIVQCSEFDFSTRTTTIEISELLVNIVPWKIEESNSKKKN